MGAGWFKQYIVDSVTFTQDSTRHWLNWKTGIAAHDGHRSRLAKLCKSYPRTVKLQMTGQIPQITDLIDPQLEGKEV